MSIPIRDSFRTLKSTLLRKFYPKTCAYLKHEGTAGLSLVVGEKASHDKEIIFISPIIDGGKKRKDKFGILHHIWLRFNDEEFDEEPQEAFIWIRRASDVAESFESKEINNSKFEEMVKDFGSDKHDRTIIHSIYVNQSLLPNFELDIELAETEDEFEKKKIADTIVMGVSRVLMHFAHELENAQNFSEELKGDLDNMENITIPEPYENPCDNLYCSMRSLARWINIVEQTTVEKVSDRISNGNEYYDFLFKTQTQSSEELKDRSKKFRTRLYECAQASFIHKRYCRHQLRFLFERLNQIPRTSSGTIDESEVARIFGEL